jgi:hypothetical protein
MQPAFERLSIVALFDIIRRRHIVENRAEQEKAKYETFMLLNGLLDGCILLNKSAGDITKKPWQKQYALYRTPAKQT